MRRVLLFCTITSSFFAFTQPAYAGDKPTASLYGPLGLNTTPNARHDETGTIRFFSSVTDPYIHAGASVQIADPLNVTLRQSAEASDINDTPDRFYPGIDLKLRLTEEDTFMPEISLGMQSAFGHKRMAGEYIAASKRFKNFDLTAGIAWGRLGSASHVSNPFRILGAHFDKERELTGEAPNTFEDWFTGKDIGFYGGIEYFTPVEGLSVKADWGADEYIIENAASDYDAPDPWAVGINYRPVSWADAQIGVIGGEKIMAQINLHSPLLRWPGQDRKHSAPQPLRASHDGKTSPAKMEHAATKHGIRLSASHSHPDKASAYLHLEPGMASPLPIGRAARHMSNYASKDIEELAIKPMVYGLAGPTIRLRRRDVKNAMAHSRGSAQEIWYSAEFDTKPARDIPKSDDIPAVKPEIVSSRSFRIFLDQDISLTEEDSGILYRSSAVISKTHQFGKGGIFGNAVRVNLADNLDRIGDIRPRSLLPVRSDVDQFADNGILLDQSYLGWTHTLRPGLYAAVTAGYLEEMYGGFGGEILYRPFGKTYAIGAEAYQVFKRDPFQDMGMGFTGDSLLSGYVHAYYEFPDTQTTIKASAGRYLAEDIGGTLTLSQRFENDARLEAFITATDSADFDLFGSTTHFYSGVRLNLPIGNLPYIPEGSAIRVDTAQLGRDTGQALEKPVDLYDLTETLSYRHLSDRWTDILK